MPRPPLLSRSRPFLRLGAPPIRARRLRAPTPEQLQRQTAQRLKQTLLRRPAVLAARPPLAPAWPAEHPIPRLALLARRPTAPRRCRSFRVPIRANSLALARLFLGASARALPKTAPAPSAASGSPAARAKRPRRLWAPAFRPTARPCARPRDVKPERAHFAVARAVLGGEGAGLRYTRGR